MDRATFELSTSMGSFHLANKEFQMLELMMSNPNQLISSERSLEKIWGYDTEAEINVAWVYVSYLRKNYLRAMPTFRLRQPEMRDILWRN